MRRGAAWGLMVSSMLLSACGGGAPTAVGQGAALSCAPGQLRVKGTLDALDFDFTEAASTYAFANKLGAAPGTLDVTTGAGKLSLEFNMLTADGASTPARGSITEAGQLDVGNCETGEFVSTLTLTADGGGATFVLRQLNWNPYCGQEAATGELRGCFGYKN